MLLKLDAYQAAIQRWLFGQLFWKFHMQGVQEEHPILLLCLDDTSFDSV